MTAEQIVNGLMKRIKYAKGGSVYKKGTRTDFEGDALLEYNADHSEFWEVVPNHDRRKTEVVGILQKFKGDTRNRISFGHLYDIHSSYDMKHEGRSIVTVYGGFNGRSDKHKWSKYFASMSDVIKAFEERFGHAWMVEWRSNCSDCHSVNIAFEDERDGTIEKAAKDFNDRLGKDGGMRAIIDLGYANDITVLNEIAERTKKATDMIPTRCFLGNIHAMRFFCLDSFNAKKSLPLCCSPQPVWGKEKTTPLGRFKIRERWLEEANTFDIKNPITVKVDRDDMPPSVSGEKRKYVFFDSIVEALYELAKESDAGRPVKTGTKLCVCNCCNIVWDGEKWIDFYREEEYDFVKHAEYYHSWLCKKRSDFVEEVIEYIGG